MVKSTTINKQATSIKQATLVSKNLLNMSNWRGGRIWDSSFPPSSFVVDRQSLTINNPTAAMVSQKVTVKPSTNYTFKVDNVAGGQGYVYGADGTQLVSGGIINADGLEFNTGAYTEVITSLYKNSGSGVNPITYNNIQLEEGTNFTSFEKYNLNAKQAQAQTPKQAQ